MLRLKQYLNKLSVIAIVYVYSFWYKVSCLFWLKKFSGEYVLLKSGHSKEAIFVVTTPPIKTQAYLSRKKSSFPSDLFLLFDNTIQSATLFSIVYIANLSFLHYLHLYVHCHYTFVAMTLPWLDRQQWSSWKFHRVEAQ